MKKNFPKLHLWLILPLIIILIGFQNYWFDFFSRPFHQHVHALSAITWMIILVLQPWIYNHKSIKLHRKIGMIGILLAGIVATSALLIVKNNLSISAGPLYPIRYSLSLIDLFLIAGFILSVVMAILKSKNIHVHARWMITTVFWILTPGMNRFFMKTLSIVNFGLPYTLPRVYTTMFLLSGVFIAILIVFDYIREKKLYFAYLLVMLVNLLSAPMLLGLKDSEWVKIFLDKL
jgi:uncharacterized membrane protein